jgi:hypothetical protein
VADKPKILSNAAKGVSNLASETVKEATKQVGQAVEETAGELLGSGSANKGGDSQQNLTIDQLKKMNQGKAAKEISELQRSIDTEKKDREKPKVSPKMAPQVGGRDVDQEIQEVRQKRRKKEREEEVLLEQVREEREREREEAAKEAQMATGQGQGPLEQTGSRKERGTALIQQRGKGREIKGGKH